MPASLLCAAPRRSLLTGNSFPVPRKRCRRGTRPGLRRCRFARFRSQCYREMQELFDAYDEHQKGRVALVHLPAVRRSDVQSGAQSEKGDGVRFTARGDVRT
jgi:hypothetical protein